MRTFGDLLQEFREVATEHITVGHWVPLVQFFRYNVAGFSTVDRTDCEFAPHRPCRNHCDAHIAGVLTEELKERLDHGRKVFAGPVFW